MFGKLFRELKQARARLLNLLTDPGNEVESVQQAVEFYFALLQGMINDVGNKESGAAGDSKIRKLIVFKWTNSICGNTPT